MSRKTVCWKRQLHRTTTWLSTDRGNLNTEPDIETPTQNADKCRVTTLHTPSSFFFCTDTDAGFVLIPSPFLLLLLGCVSLAKLPSCNLFRIFPKQADLASGQWARLHIQTYLYQHAAYLFSLRPFSPGSRKYSYLIWRLEIHSRSLLLLKAIHSAVVMLIW